MNSDHLSVLKQKFGKRS